MIDLLPWAASCQLILLSAFSYCFWWITHVLVSTFFFNSLKPKDMPHMKAKKQITGAKYLPQYYSYYNQLKVTIGNKKENSDVCSKLNSVPSRWGQSCRQTNSYATVTVHRPMIHKLMIHSSVLVQLKSYWGYFLMVDWSKIRRCGTHFLAWNS